MTRVLIVGTSARAAAESAARAGFDVTALDAFGDLDQHPSVRALSVQRDCGGGPFTARSAARAAQSVSCDAVTYLSPFENHPRTVGMLARGRTLWGNSPAVLRCVRDPIRVADALRHRELAVPAVLGADSEEALDLKAGLWADRDTDLGSDERWLVKPLASGGGHSVRARDRLVRVPRGCYFQERIVGTPGSVSFVAAGRQAVPLCVSRQLVGDPAFGASGYRYCGTILAPCGDSFELGEELVEKTRSLAQAIAEEFDVVGVNGVDFVARDGNPYAVEVNPRWSASMELAERAYGISVFAAHARACAHGVLPVFDLAHARRRQSAVGKAVVFARTDATVGDTRQWTQDDSVRDVPQPGERISAGQPVCTVMAEQRTAAACYEALVHRACRVYAELIPARRT